MGNELAESYGQRNAVPPEVVIRVNRRKFVAKIAVADYLGVGLAVASVDSAWMASGWPSVPAIATLRG